MSNYGVIAQTFVCTVLLKSKANCYSNIGASQHSTMHVSLITCNIGPQNMAHVSKSNATEMWSWLSHHPILAPPKHPFLTGRGGVPELDNYRDLRELVGR